MQWIHPGAQTSKTNQLRVCKFISVEKHRYIILLCQENIEVFKDLLEQLLRICMHPKKTTLISALEKFNVHFENTIYTGSAEQKDKIARADAYMLKQMVMEIENAAKHAKTGQKLSPGLHDLLRIFRSLDKPVITKVVKSPFLARFVANMKKRPAPVLPCSGSSTAQFQTPSPAKKT